MTRLKLPVALLFVGLTSALWGQDAKASAPPTMAQAIDRMVSGVEGELVPAVEAMPEDKLSFAPTAGEFKGVRNFSEQAKHIAAVNYLISSAILGEKPPVDIGGENGPASLKTKADIVKFLKESFAYTHKAVATINEKNSVETIKSPFGDGNTTRLTMAVLVVGHCFDHYGQIVEYLRMNSIIPPASRG